MPSFIYVFSMTDKAELERRGLKLLKANDTSEQYIFLAGEEFNFAESDMSYVMSDVLTF